MDEELVPMLSLEEAARITRLSLKKLTEATRTHLLPSRQIDGRVRVRLTDLEHFKEAHGGTQD